MSIIQYRRTPAFRSSPFSRFHELQRELNRLFDVNVVAAAPSGPALDVVQDQDQIQVVVELPGVKKEAIELSLQQNLLTIRGERKDETEHKEGQTQRSERCFGRFERTVQLPTEVNPDAVSATYQDGLLTIRLPKAEEAKPKQININLS